MTRTAGCTEPFDVVDPTRTRQLLLVNRFLSCAAGCLAAVLCAAPLRAEGEAPAAGVRLLWQAEAGTEPCLTRTELERLVEVELERSVFVSDDASGARLIRVRLERDAANGGFRALV